MRLTGQGSNTALKLVMIVVILIVLAALAYFLLIAPR
jgi:hypothetical protein